MVETWNKCSFGEHIGILQKTKKFLQIIHFWKVCTHTHTHTQI